MSAVARVASGLLLFALAAEAAPSPGGGNAVQSLDYAMLYGRVAVRVGLRQALKQAPAGFRLLHPAARIVLDLPGTSIATAQHVYPVGGRLLRGVHLVAHGPHTRLVIHLGRPVAYEVLLEGNSVIILLDRGGGEVFAEPAGHFAAGDAAARRFQLRQVGFQRGADREGRVVVSLSGAGSEIAIRERGARILVELGATVAPPEALRRLDLLDFATPVAALTTRATGGGAQIEIEPVGAYEYSAYQEGSELVIAFRPVVPRVEPSAWR